jgi:hypothetical protein
MYDYILKVSAARRKTPLLNETVEAIQKACDNANQTPNSKRYGREFSFISKMDDYTIQLRLKSKTPIIATRAISSITRALLRIQPREKLEYLQYNGSILAANIMEDETEFQSSNNMQPYEIVQTVMEIFFGQTDLKSNHNKNLAKNAAEEISNIVMNYRNNKLN